MPEKSTERKGWIGIDLDGTLADSRVPWTKDFRRVGAPIPTMVEFVKHLIEAGEDVRIFTARADCYWKDHGLVPREEVEAPIRAWCKEHLGKELPITNIKDYFMEALYDDKAIHVEKNTGRIIG